MNETQERIMSNLGNGIEESISRKDLSMACNISDRATRDEIAELRKMGVPIVSNTKTGGYYLPKTKYEALDYIIGMESRAKRTFESIKATREWLKNKEQERLDI